MNWINKSNRRKIFRGLLLLVASFTLIVVFAEIFVRIFTPKGIYLTSVYDDELGLIMSPESRVIYNKASRTKHFVNRDGFLDINHNPDDTKTIKVAFFGDSFVEAMQVPIAQKFYRILPRKLAHKEFEYFGFGISGNGTLSSYLNYRKQARKYALDIIVYVFAENDPGDNISMITRSDLRPHANLTDSPPGFEIERTYRKYDSLPVNIIRSIKGSSLLVNLVAQRILLLKQKGIVLKPLEKEKQMTTLPEEKIPGQNDLPSAWPDYYRDYAGKLAFNILQQWVTEVRDDGRDFAVFYVPRGEGTILNDDKGKDSWKGWLTESCSRLNIEIIYPSEIFVQKLRDGIHMYDDHWTAHGHGAVALVIEEWLSKHLKEQENI
jgi:hypothetical protein